MYRLAIIAVLSLLVGGCATSTSPGSVGVARPQLMMVSSGGINAQAAAAYTKLSSEMITAGRLNTDPVQSARVKRIAQELIQQTPAFRPDALSWPWEVNVIQSEQVNAFCMPGGKIGITSAMITKLALTDAELAAVMGHEIAHALREHSREKHSQNVLANAVVAGVASTGRQYSGTAAVLTQVGSQLFIQLPYSREMETESDSIGLELMARAAYDPSLAAGLWIKMAAHSGDGAATDFFSTHPGHEKRTESIQTLVPRVSPLYQAALLKSQPSMASAAPTASTSARSAASPESRATSALIQVAPQPSGASLTNASSAAVSAQGSRTRQYAVGPDSHQLERALRGNSCSDAPIAALVEKGAGYEKYEVACTAGPSLRFRCEFGNCSAIN